MNRNHVIMHTCASISSGGILRLQFTYYDGSTRRGWFFSRHVVHVILQKVTGTSIDCCCGCETPSRNMNPTTTHIAGDANSSFLSLSHWSLQSSLGSCLTSLWGQCFEGRRNDALEELNARVNGLNSIVVFVWIEYCLSPDTSTL